MSPAIGTALMVLVGAQLSQQAPVNRALAARIGPLPSAWISFGVGTAVILAACVVSGQLSGFGKLAEVEPDELLGGVAGAIFVLVALLVVRTIGAGGVAAATVAGQMLSSVVLDAVGALGLPQKPLTPAIVVGAAAVIVGTVFVAYDRSSADRLSTSRGAEALAAMVFAGALVGVQVPLNGHLAETTGGMTAGLINFLVGWGLISVALLATSTRSNLGQARKASWYLWLGGVFGAVNVLSGLTLVDTIGAGAVAAATVSGQVLVGLVSDRLGLFGLGHRHLTFRRFGGAALLIAGTVAISLL